jgi:hypothetical protein
VRAARRQSTTARLGACLLLVAAGCAAPSARPDQGLTRAPPGDTGSYVVVAVARAPARITNPVHGGYVGGTGSYAADPAAQRTLRSLADVYNLTPVDTWPIRVLGLECAVFGIAANASRPDVLAALSRDARVRLAQPLQDFATRGNGGGSGADPYEPLQSGLRDLEVQGAHRWSTGRGVRVAIVDTGLDTTHPDLAGRIEAQRNFVDRDARQFNLDRHGTAVAGVIAADAGNGVGIVGVAPQARLLALKACWQLEPGRDAARCNTFTLAQALAAAIELHAGIINLSLTGPRDPLLEALVRHAIAAGIVVVGAAGPDANAAFPAAITDVLAVASSDDPDNGRATLRAPGREILTLAPAGRYDFASGDSIATAMVSGAAALLLARDPSLGGQTVRGLLERTSGAAPDGGGRDGVAGYPINACRALTLLLNTSGCATTRVGARGEDGRIANGG